MQTKLIRQTGDTMKNIEENKPEDPQQPEAPGALAEELERELTKNTVGSETGGWEADTGKPSKDKKRKRTI